MNTMLHGGIRRTLRFEALLVLLAALYGYHQLGQSWWLFAALLLLPDVSLLAYLCGPRAGAWAYNWTHSYVGPLLVGLLGAPWHPLCLPVAVIWVAHIGMDRALGYGLKSPQGFHWTHLGCIGKHRMPPDRRP